MKEDNPNLSTINRDTTDSRDPKDVVEILENMPPEDREVIESVFFAMEKRSSYSGPLPHPSFFREYDEVLPGAAERILSMTEKEQAHRCKMEEEIVRGQTSSTFRGQIWGGILVALFGVAGFVLALLGQTLVSSIVFGTTILGIATVFVLAQLPKNKNKMPAPPSEME